MPELHLACISYFAPSQLSPVLPSQDSGCSLRTIFRRFSHLLPTLSRTLPRRPSGAYLGCNCTCCSRRRFEVSRKWRRTRKKVPGRLAATCHPRDPLPPVGKQDTNQVRNWWITLSCGWLLTELVHVDAGGGEDGWGTRNLRVWVGGEVRKNLFAFRGPGGHWPTDGWCAGRHYYKETPGEGWRMFAKKKVTAFLPRGQTRREFRGYWSAMVTIFGQ